MPSATQPRFSRILRTLDKLSIRHLDKKIADLPLLKQYVTGKTGLEIGGPSPIFSNRGYIPVYPYAKTVDGCNFSTNTVWENTIKEGPNYTFDQQLLGFQFIADATDLSKILTDQYDFILSSHSLEHVANPIKALKEWLRVLKPGGAIILVVPDKFHTFDHKRPYTTFEHLIDDYRNNVGEDDLTHLEEILALHDLSMDIPAGDIFQFRNRCNENLSNRCIHHHVFSFELLEQLFTYLHIKITVKRSAWPYHMIISGIKLV